MTKHDGAGGAGRTTGVLKSRTAFVLTAGCLLLGLLAAPASATFPPGHAAGGDGWVLSTNDPAKNYSPTFVGNGYLAARVPAAGHGYSSKPIVTQSQLAGFYGAPSAGQEERAGLPAWTTLGFGRGGDVYGLGEWSCGFGQLCPAAYGKISGGAFVENSHPGATVGAYLAGLNTNNTPTVGGTDVIPVRDAPAGPATLAVRYGNGSGSPQTVHIGVNGTVQQLSVPSLAGWDDWAVVTVPVTLTAGANKLEVTVTEGDTARVNVDYLAVYPDGAPPPAQVASDAVGTTTNYRQSLDLRTGVLTTSFDWTSPAGDTTGFVYEVNANRADGHLGTVSVRAVPHWSGTATVVDEFDGRGLDHASTSDARVDGRTATLSQTVVSDGNLVTAGMTSVLRVDEKAVPTRAMADPGAGSAGQRADFPVRAGVPVRVTKYVGVASSVDTDRPLAAATPRQAAAATAARAAGDGYRRALARNEDAWSRLWQSSISVPGDTTMTAQVHASMFYLLASVRAGVVWSASPGGLSSDGYSGHVFWDMETWMYPALLAQYPDIAADANTYRQQRLPAAQAAAAALSTPDHPIKGAKFPWQSALTGKETTPDWSPDGKQEIHINSDIALAQWQYYEASGDQAWLRDKAWPVLQGIADYWATRAVPDPAGGYAVKDVKGADEYHDNVDNSVSTNAGAQASLRIAIRAAGILGRTADPVWAEVADGLKIPVDAAANIHPEFDGYAGQTVKQADVTLLQYPWAVPMSPELAQNDLDYYGPRTDPGGPSMTDAIATIAGAALGSPGCAVYTSLRKSADPYLAAPFDQWYETRTGGAFDFTTGQGGYLQEFLYGFTGLRWGTDAVTIDPFLPPQLPGVDITGVKWHGRTFDLSVGRQSTKLTLRSGPPLPVRVGIGRGDVRQVRPGTALQVPTRHPGGDPADCGS
ncbi:glycosyl hydrolase family 65 protein [Amycolatopsis sp. A133]|uniref:glycosyl hydrolase family 65 protein n=1 Tax=Amycolatopsis sp. A133 TaxID=3064472 RepID=UPI0027F5401A|nr:glycosyl hydrolase family 65 protein [Amycolatopsis sp. A133]MDQ7808593.1 glycosyl hydrolase family 65 protein [Amycolatopsis sp. A133]